MARIFISYRRKDAATAAGRIYDQIAATFGAENVFKDVDDIPLGINFKTYLEKAVSECEVLLVIIGPLWVSVVDDAGRKRLDDPDDFVRIEVESALKRENMIVIPLLVNGAIMPSRSDLPSGLAELTLRNAAQVRDDPDFHRDMERLIDHLKQVLKPSTAKTPLSPPRQSRNYAPYLLVAALLVVVIALAAQLLSPKLGETGDKTPTKSASTSVVEVPSTAPSIAPPPTDAPTVVPTPAPSSTPRPSLTPPPSETPLPSVRVTARHIPVFDGPGYDFTPIGFLNADDAALPIKRSDEWINVVFPAGGSGWIKNDPNQIVMNIPLDSLNGSFVPAPQPVAPVQLFPPIIARITSPAGQADGLAWDANAGLLWEVDRTQNGQLYALDLNGNVVKQFPLAGAYASGLTFDGQALWYPETNLGKIFQLDTNSGSVLKTLPPPGYGNVGDLEWDGATIWAASSSPYRIYQIDPVTGDEISSIPGPIPPGYTGDTPSLDGDNQTTLGIYGLTFDGAYLWVSESITHTIMKINPYTGALLAYFVDDEQTFPIGLAWVYGTMWVSDFNSQQLIQFQF